MEQAQILERIDKGIASTLEKQAAIDVKLTGIEKAQAEQAKANADVEARAVKMETWLKEVEEKTAKARFGNGSGRFGESDALKSAIPTRFHPSIQNAARLGCKDPVERAAVETWFKLSIKLMAPGPCGVRSEQVAKLQEEKDKLELVMNGVETRVAMQEDTLIDGGYTIPTPVEAMVLRQIEDANVIRAISRKMVMVTKTHYIPDLTTGISVAIVDEEASIGQTEPVFGQKLLTAKKFAARGLVSMELLQDSAIGIVDFWNTLVTEQIGLAEEAQALEGTGSGSNFTGLVAAAGVVAFANTTGANGGPPLYDDLWATMFSATKRSSRRTQFNTAWFMHRIIARKIFGLKDTQGNPVWTMPVAGLQTTFNGTGPATPDGFILGYPVFVEESDRISITRTVGSSPDTSNVYFGPFGYGMIFGDLLGISFGISEHVAWNTAQIGLRMIKRTGILVGVPAAFVKYTGNRTN